MTSFASIRMCQQSEGYYNRTETPAIERGFDARELFQVNQLCHRDF